MVIPSVDSNSRGAKSMVILPIKPRSFTVVGNFKIWSLPTPTNLIAQIVLLPSDYCSITEFSSLKLVTDGK
jgi:hypothetical protein